MTIRTILRGIALTGLALMVMACTGGPSTSGGASAPTGPGPSLGSLPEGFPLGSWTTTISPDDLRAAGMTDDGLIRENTGVFVTTYSGDGTWSTAQTTEAPIKWPLFQGTYTVAGDGLIDQTTTFPPDYAGEVVRFTWRMEDGALILGVPEPPDDVLPIVTETHPWRRVE